MEKYPRLEKLCDWPTVVGALLGAGAVVFLIYPPAPNWGSSAKWGDIGTWLGAMTTAATAIAALWIANSERRERRRLVKQRTMLLAVDLYGVFTGMLFEIRTIRKYCSKPTDYLSGHNASEMRHRLQAQSVAKLPSGLLLDGIADELATALISLKSAWTVFDHLMDVAVAEYRDGMSTAELTEHFDHAALLDRIQWMLAACVRATAKAGAPKAAVDFLRRPDGTRVI